MSGSLKRSESNKLSNHSSFKPNQLNRSRQNDGSFKRAVNTTFGLIKQKLNSMVIAATGDNQPEQLNNNSSDRIVRRNTWFVNNQTAKQNRPMIAG